MFDSETDSVPCTDRGILPSVSQVPTKVRQMRFYYNRRCVYIWKRIAQEKQIWDDGGVMKIGPSLLEL